MPLLLLLLNFWASSSANAYPEFIGYKYGSCLTCHFNGNGSGPLNDYGRALWASEIAGRAFAGGRNEEQLGEASGVLGSTPMPWWLRPGAKYRNLYLVQNPGGNEKYTSILMQAEVNAAVFFRRDQSLGFIGSIGYVPIPRRLQTRTQEKDVNQWISREHYLRWQSSEFLWWYIGMTDKVFGIRTVNHTAYSRSRTGLSMNDQSHGVIAQYIKPTWELSVNGFVGNLYQDAELRQMGLSSMMEYEVIEATRVGASVLYSKNKYVGNRRLAGHVRRGFGFGSAVLLEMGLIQDVPKSAANRLGYYVFSEAMQRVVRGYHLFISGQAYKDQLRADRADALKASLGLLAFPMQRLEFRVEVENTRQLKNSNEVNEEGWAMLGQVHIAL